MIKLYIASKTKHAEDWRRYRYVYKGQGIQVTSTWIDEAGVGQTKSWEDLWLRCIGEARDCDILLCYADGEEILKGALVEVGAALSAGKFVYYVGSKTIGSWLHHPLVFEFASLHEAFLKIKSLVPKEVLPNGERGRK